MYYYGIVKLISSIGLLSIILMFISRIEVIFAQDICDELSNITTPINRTVVFYCRSTSNFKNNSIVINWKNLQLKDAYLDKPKTIFTADRVNPTYNSTHFVNNSFPGQFDLVITNVQFDHAGTYIFKREYERNSNSTVLSVYDQPSCQIEDGSQLICTITYAGLMDPILRCIYNTRLKREMTELEFNFTKSNKNQIDFWINKNLTAIASDISNLWCNLQPSIEIPYDKHWKFLHQFDANSELIEFSSNVTSAVNRSVVFYCRLCNHSKLEYNSIDMSWSPLRLRENVLPEVCSSPLYNGERLSDEYSSTCFINTSFPGQFDLVLSKIQLQHAGTYRFQRDNETESTILSIYENLPSCQIDDRNHLICNVTYAGFIDPTLRCSYNTSLNRGMNEHHFNFAKSHTGDFGFRINSSLKDIDGDMSSLWCKIHPSVQVSEDYLWEFFEELVTIPEDKWEKEITTDTVNENTDNISTPSSMTQAPMSISSMNITLIVIIAVLVIVILIYVMRKRCTARGISQKKAGEYEVINKNNHKYQGLALQPHHSLAEYEYPDEIYEYPDDLEKDVRLDEVEEEETNDLSVRSPPLPPERRTLQKGAEITQQVYDENCTQEYEEPLEIHDALQGNGTEASEITGVNSGYLTILPSSSTSLNKINDHRDSILTSEYLTMPHDALS